MWGVLCIHVERGVGAARMIHEAHSMEDFMLNDIEPIIRIISEDIDIGAGNVMAVMIEECASCHV